MSFDPELRGAGHMLVWHSGLWIRAAFDLDSLGMPCVLQPGGVPFPSTPSYPNGVHPPTPQWHAPPPAPSTHTPSWHAPFSSLEAHIPPPHTHQWCAPYPSGAHTHTHTAAWYALCMSCACPEHALCMHPGPARSQCVLGACHARPVLSLHVHHPSPSMPCACPALPRTRSAHAPSIP